MKLMKYQEIIALAKDKIKENMAPLRACEMKRKAELELAKIESHIVEKENSIQELTSIFPIDFDRVLDALDDLDLTKRRKDQFAQIIEEMFS